MPKAKANGLDLEYESFGDKSAPAILLIMGLGGQLIHWPDDFCSALAEAGYRVIRFDNRDVGLSTRLDHLGRPRLLQAGVLGALGLPVRAPYKLNDMAQDAVSLLDALHIKSAHLVGVSMGGMIAQIIAAKHPERVQSLVLVMTTSGHRSLPQPSLPVRLRLVQRPEGRDRESLIRHSMQTWRMIGSPGFPQDDATLRQKVERAFDRAHYPRGLARQTLAIIASGSRTPLLGRIKAPTLVIHGKDDPLVRVAAGPDLAKRIRGAKLEIIEGMGHDLPPMLLPRLANLVLGHVKRAA
ncbi:MAG TPA: alpha/beta hydrolase [Solimonas sp.]|nr:alpha/beta hydrolase [Solimonas sp.]